MTFTPEVYDQIRAGAQRSAALVVPRVYELVRPETVIDVGGGEGWWGDVFARKGASVSVVDESVEPGCRDGIEYVRKDLAVDDLAAGDERFDLAVCLEVAEHLPPERADGLVAMLCRIAPVVLFSAAIPKQGGHGHLNEQWPWYWADRFYASGFLVSEDLRWEFWDDENIEPWYRQNLLLAARSRPPTASGLAFTRYPRSVVHPGIFAWKTG